MYEINLSDVVLSFILTWGIGLAPPVLIRYVFRKEPTDKWPAIGICSLLWLLNVILFTALGSQSKTHGVLALIAYVSYWLLRRPSQKTEVVVFGESTPEKPIASDATASGRTFTEGHRRHLGWIRLGIVISTAWVLGVGSYALYDYKSLKTDLAAEITAKPWLADPVVDGKWEITGQQSFFTECEMARVDVICSPRLTNLALRALAPVLVFWALSVVILQSARWVRAGFRNGT